MNYYDNQTYYDILGVKKDASLENIMKARDRLKYGSSDDRVPFTMWNKIDKAYDILSNSETRREYDKSLENNELNFDSLNIGDTPNDNLVEVNSNPSVIEPQKNDVIASVPDELQQRGDTISQLEEPQNAQESTDMVPLYSPKDEEKKEEPLEQTINDNLDDKENTLNDDEEDRVEEVEQQTIDNNDSILRNDIFEKLKFKPSDNSSFKDFNSVNTIRNAKKVGLGVAAFASFLTPIGPLVSTVAVGGIIYLINKRVKKKVKKAKLTKESYTGIITEVQTTESRLIEESNNRLMANIDRLLQSDYNDAKLQKYKLSFENQVELLEKMVENRKNTKKQKGLLTSRELRIQALKGQLHKAKKKLKYIDKNIKRDELIDSIGAENVNFNSKLMKNLTIGNKYLQFKDFHQKIKLQGGPLKSVKNFIASKKAMPDELKQDIMEEQQARYR